MKKKKVLYFIALLLIVVIPFSITFGKFDHSSFIRFEKAEGTAAHTYTDGRYRFSNGSASAYYINGSSSLPSYCIKRGVCKSSESKYWMAEAVTGTGTSNEKFYHSYCLQFGKRADGRPDGFSRPYLDAYVYNDHFDSGVIKDHAGNDISDAQRDMLQDVLASGYHYSSDHTKTVYQLTNGDHIKQMFAKQVIIWEIVEGARTNFDTEPNVYHASDSAYHRVITSHGNLLNYYKAHLNAAKEYREKRTNGSPIFGKEYFMRWNSSTNRYEAVITEPLNGFSNCKADNNSVTITTRTATTGTETVVSSPSAINTSTITCSYVVGDGSSTYTYFIFSSPYGAFQHLVYGEGGSTIKKSFTVRSEASNVYINKYNESGQRVSNAEFSLTLKSNPSITFNLTGNKTTQSIEKSGIYILRETNPPHGYGRVAESELNIDIKNGSITSSNSSIRVSYNNQTNTFNIDVVDEEKTFEIRKVNESNAELKGATFKIYNGNNFSNEVKFNKTNNIFSYSETGTVTNIVDNNYANYSIRFLPKGIYKVVETSAPSPYILPSDTNDRLFYIKVENEYNIFDCSKDSTCKNPKLTVNNAITIKNYKIKIDIIKTGQAGALLEGVKFVLLDENKSNYIKSNLNSGNYDYSTKVSDISDATVYITNSSGKITINNIPSGTYYLKEIETIDPYLLPEGNDAYTKLIIDMKIDGPRLNNKTSLTESISNATKEFNFYKVDENGNYLSGGKFKVQRFNEEIGKYEDVRITSIENDGSYMKMADVFKEDTESGRVQFTLSHGIATFVDMTPGSTYRILELEAPSGYEIANVENSAVIKLDRKGYAKGSATIINQRKSVEGSTAQAELVIEIQTGRKLIRYGLIIAGTLIIIIALMSVLIYIAKKRK